MSSSRTPILIQCWRELDNLRRSLKLAPTMIHHRIEPDDNNCGESGAPTAGSRYRVPPGVRSNATCSWATKRAFKSAIKSEWRIGSGAAARVSVILKGKFQACSWERCRKSACESSSRFYEQHWYAKSNTLRAESGMLSCKRSDELSGQKVDFWPNKSDSINSGTNPTEHERR